MVITQKRFDSYLAMIQNSQGTSMFRNYFADYDGQLKDGLQNGDLSCAFFVSAILTIWSAIDKPHATVSGTIKAMENAGWHSLKQLTKPQPGDVLVWGAQTPQPVATVKHQHIGFYLGNHLAVSNSSSRRKIVVHDWQAVNQNQSTITAVYRGRHLIMDFRKEIE